MNRDEIQTIKCYRLLFVYTINIEMIADGMNLPQVWDLGKTQITSFLSVYGLKTDHLVMFLFP